MAVELVQDLIDFVSKQAPPKPISVISPDDIINQTKFSFEKQVNWRKFKRILVLGMGGGCDVFSAYSYYKYLSSYFQKMSLDSLQSTPTLLFGNCLSIRKDLQKHKKVCNYLYEVHQCNEFKDANDPSAMNNYGTTLLEQSIPTEYDVDIFNGPYLFIVPIKEFNLQINNIDLATLVNNECLSESYKYLNIDLIIGIDNGGDSLTCGIDYKHHQELARDRQVLYSMKYNKYNIPYIHYVFGAGCDGESTKKQLYQSVMDKSNNFVGSFEINNETMDIMRERCKYVSNKRTPNIMYNAYLNKSKNKNKHQNNYDYDLIEMPRGRTPRIKIPRSWLYSCWVFTTKFDQIKSQITATI